MTGKNLLPTYAFCNSETCLLTVTNQICLLSKKLSPNLESLLKFLIMNWVMTPDAYVTEVPMKYCQAKSLEKNLGFTVLIIFCQSSVADQNFFQILQSFPCFLFYPISHHPLPTDPRPRPPFFTPPRPPPLIRPYNHRHHHRPPPHLPGHRGGALARCSAPTRSRRHYFAGELLIHLISGCKIANLLLKIIYPLVCLLTCIFT